MIARLQATYETALHYVYHEPQMRRMVAAVNADRAGADNISHIIGKAAMEDLLDLTLRVSAPRHSTAIVNVFERHYQAASIVQHPERKISVLIFDSQRVDIAHVRLSDYRTARALERWGDGCRNKGVNNVACIALNTQSDWNTGGEHALAIAKTLSEHAAEMTRVHCEHLLDRDPIYMHAWDAATVQKYLPRPLVTKLRRYDERGRMQSTISAIARTCGNRGPDVLIYAYRLELLRRAKALHAFTDT